MQFTIVNAVPFDFGWLFCATKVEKSGESAITTNDQKIRNEIKTVVLAKLNIRG